MDTYEIIKSHIYPRVFVLGPIFTGPHSDVMQVSPTHGQINAGGVRLNLTDIGLQMSMS